MPLRLISRFPTRNLKPVLCATTALALALFAGSAANAQIVYNNGAPNNVTATVSDSSANALIAEDFTFAAGATFNQVNWWGIYALNNTPTEPDNFTILFHNTTGGVPDSVAFQTFNPGAVSRVDTGVNLLNSDLYQYQFDLPSAVTLPAGTYAISIYNDTSADTNDQWFWATSDSQAGIYFRRTSTTSPYTTQAEREHAFNLVNVASANAPEPGSLVLFALAGLTVAPILKQRKRA